MVQSVPAADAPAVEVVGTTHRLKRPDAADETERYARSLSLSGAQKAEIGKVLAGAQTERERYEDAHAEFSRRMMELQREIRELNRKFQEESRAEGPAEARRRDAIRALLTPGQRRKFDAIEASRRREEEEIRRKDQEEAQRGKDPLPPDGAAGRAP